MLYNKSINQFLKENYVDTTDKADLIADFFNHISSCSKALQEMLKDNLPTSTNYSYYHTKLKSFIPKKISLSIIILCKDEERCIRRCLTNVFNEIDQDDEVIVIDTGSVDNSLNIIKEFSLIKLIKCKWQNNFSQIRNIGISSAEKDWIFFIDADEVLKPQSLTNLKCYLNTIEWLKIDAIAICPTIINHNQTIAQGVRRIFRTDSDIRYYGIVHEELRKKIPLLGNDISYISFDNILLFHDGYQEEIVSQKNKSEIYTKGLKYMVSLEPLHPRWLYFLCRDSKSLFTPHEYVENLKKIIELCGSEENFGFYKIRSLSSLISFYLEQQNLDNAIEYLHVLKQITPTLSDILYFETLIEYIKIKQALAKRLNNLIYYRQNHNVDCGSLDSRLYHIDSLIALMFFEIEEYDHAFAIYNKLKNENAFDCSKQYESLYSTLHSFYN